MKRMGLPSVIAACLTLGMMLPGQAQERSEPRGWLGITYSEVTGGDSRQVQVGQVFPRSPAAEAGIESGDRIVSWNGSPEVRRALESAGLRPGDTIQLRIRRDDREARDVAVVVGRRPLTIAGLARGYPGWRSMPPDEWNRWREEMQAAGEEMARAFRGWGMDGDSSAVFRWRGPVDHDSLRIHADSLHRRLRIMLRDSLGPRLEEATARIRALEWEMIPGDSLGSGLAEVTARIQALDGEMMPHTFFELARSGLAGAEFEEMNDGLAAYFGTDEGLLVLRVAPETPAARAGLQPGDVVIRANGEPVTSISALRARMLRPSSQGGEVLRLEILRRGARHTLQLERSGRVR